MDFENGKRKPEPFFPDVHRSFKFCTLIAGGPDRSFANADCAFFQQDAAEAEAIAFPIAPSDFSAVNPNTGTAPVFRSPRDAEITLGIYRRVPVLVDRRTDPPVSQWPVRYFTMFHMTNDSDKFRTAVELERIGAYRDAGQRWERGTERWLPLYEGKMVQAYDHRAASVTVNLENLHRPGQPRPATPEQHADPSWIPSPQFWVGREDVLLPDSLSAVVAFKEITATTNARTIIASLVPSGGFSNKLPILMHNEISTSTAYSRYAPLLVANLNSMELDAIARQKVHGTTLNLYIVEQFPVIARAAYSRGFGPKTAEDIIREDVLRLTYTAHDMEAFAREQGYDGPPFRWDEEDRLRRRARLDAVFFHLYGIDRDTANYILACSRSSAASKNNAMAAVSSRAT